MPRFLQAISGPHASKVFHGTGQIAPEGIPLILSRPSVKKRMFYYEPQDARHCSRPILRLFLSKLSRNQNFQEISSDRSCNHAYTRVLRPSDRFICTDYITGVILRYRTRYRMLGGIRATWKRGPFLCNLKLLTINQPPLLVGQSILIFSFRVAASIIPGQRKPFSTPGTG